MKEWRWINYRYVVESCLNKWCVVDQRSGETIKGNIDLESALQIAIEMNGG